jgi:hypothetical protein
LRPGDAIKKRRNIGLVSPWVFPTKGDCSVPRSHDATLSSARSGDEAKADIVDDTKAICSLRQMGSQQALDEPILHGGNTDDAQIPVLLGDRPPTEERKPVAVQQFPLDAFEVPFEIAVKRLERNAIYATPSLAPGHAPEILPGGTEIGDGSQTLKS